MKRYNPIYLCFCKATGRKPSAKITTYHHFTGWVMEQGKVYMQEHGIKGELSSVHTVGFHRWLKEKYEIEEVEN